MKYKDEIIIMIEYYNDIPFTVLTEYSTFDFELYNNDWLMYYESGGGKNWKEENGEKIIDLEWESGYYDSSNWKIWIDSQYILKNKTGIEILKKPLMLPSYCDEKQKYNNPFEVGEEVGEIYWCEKCQCHYHEDGCPDHGYEEEE